MKLPVLLLVSLPRLGAAACTCKTTPTSPNQQATADNANAKFIADLSIVDYGFECKKHDEGKGLLCDVTDPPDYCAQPWCIVDEAACTDVKLRAVSYTADTTDKFSYEACETSFTGNSWVGYCKNCESPFELTSFCTCGGSAGCPCKKAAPQTTAASGKPAFVGDAGRSYGSGCKAHDTGLGDCKGKTDTANGQPNDWCLDEWCIVDRLNCDVKDRAVSYTTATDYFSFETCDTSFSGNSWVGYCKTCTEASFKDNSYCEGNCTPVDASPTAAPTTAAPETSGAKQFAIVTLAAISCIGSSLI